MVAAGERHVGGNLQYPLSEHKVVLKVGAERITAPSDSRDTDARFAEQGVIDSDGYRGLRRELLEDGAADDGEDGLSRKAMAGEETIVGRPIMKLLPAGGQQSGHGVTSKAEETAQRERLRAFGDALLGEGWEAFSPELLDGGEDVGGVFFKADAGGLRRRRTSRLLSSIDHSTVSPRMKSIA
jgi:hypothetical protein